LYNFSSDVLIFYVLERDYMTTVTELNNNKFLSEMSGSHGDDYEDYSRL